MRTVRKLQAVWITGTVLCLLAVTGMVEAQEKGRELHGTPLDDLVIFTETVPTAGPVLIQWFSTERTDFGTGKSAKKKKKHNIAMEMKMEAPVVLASTLISRLGAKELFPEVAEYREGGVPENAIIVEGEFTKLNPGSRGKRYWVGMGAGKSKVCVEGRVVTAQGAVLMTFAHCRSQAIGTYGGGAKKQMLNDVIKTAVRLVEFIENWAQGQYHL